MITKAKVYYDKDLAGYLEKTGKRKISNAGILKY